MKTNVTNNALWFANKQPTFEQSLEILGKNCKIVNVEDGIKLASIKLLTAENALYVFKQLTKLVKETNAVAIFGEFPPLFRWFINDLGEGNNFTDIQLYESHTNNGKHLLWVHTCTLKIPKE